MNRIYPNSNKFSKSFNKLPISTSARINDNSSNIPLNCIQDNINFIMKYVYSTTKTEILDVISSSLSQLLLIINQSNDESRD